MKVEWTVQGVFDRSLPQGAAIDQSVSLPYLLQEVQAVATQHYGRSPHQLRHSFDLDCLPESVLVSLLKQANAAQSEEELYQIPSLKLLQPVSTALPQATANIYRYQFRGQEADWEFMLDLAPDDPQLPWIGHDRSEVNGSYTLYLDDSRHPHLPKLLVSHLWKQAQTHWQELSTVKLIHLALQALDPTCFPVRCNSTLTLWLESQDLTLEQRAALTALRQLRIHPNFDLTLLSESEHSLVQAYQSRYGQPIDAGRKLHQLTVEPIPSTHSNLVIGRGDRHNRAALETIIKNARQFLLISSYIIEDEAITRLICQKATELPQGIWILTDLRDEVVDYLDLQVENRENWLAQYHRSNENKRTCLRLLLEANVSIRSGSFHLKTVISEQSAYLGSCNLTGGSLGRNFEAGIVFQRNQTHAELLEQFRYYWEWCSRDQVISASNGDRFSLRSILRPYLGQQSNPVFAQLLSLRNYQQDLAQELANFKGQVQIYTRTFQPSADIYNLLSNRLRSTTVFVDSGHCSQVYAPNIRLIPIHNLHAKVTLLGNQLAYIGGINFKFNPNFSFLSDLMYKTTQSEELQQIRQSLTNLQA